MDLRFPAPSSDEAIAARDLATGAAAPSSKAARAAASQAKAPSGPISRHSEALTISSVAPIYHPFVAATEGESSSTYPGSRGVNGTSSEARGKSQATASGALT